MTFPANGLPSLSTGTGEKLVMVKCLLQSKPPDPCVTREDAGRTLNLGCGPLTVTVGNEGLVRDSLLKMVHNPANDWHPVRGPHPS